MAEWSPEIDVNEALAAALIGEQFAALAGERVRALASGWDNAVFTVGEPPRWAFRFPRRAVAVPGVRREIALLADIAPFLSVPIPVPRWVGEPSVRSGYPWPFFGATLIDGAEPADVVLADTSRRELGAGLGATLRALHAPALMRRVGDRLPYDPNRRGDMPFRVAATRKRLDQLGRSGLWEPPPSVSTLLDAAAELPPADAAVVAHGDLHLRHVLLDPGGRLAGIIDWGDLCRADASIDLPLYWSLLDPPGRTAFLEAYGDIPDAALLRSRVLAIFLCAALALYAADEAMTALRREAVAGLDRTVMD